MLYDLQAIGVDLRDLWRPNSGVTPRYVLSLVGQLSPASAFAASMRGGQEFRAWTPELYLLAGVVNLLNAANRQRAGKKTKEPLVKPPGSGNARPKRMSLVEFAALDRRARTATN